MIRHVIIPLLIVLFSIQTTLQPPIVTTNKSEYKIGETVIITIFNPNTVAISFPNPNPYKVISIEKNEVVYTPITIQVVYKLDGRKSLVLSWNQTDNDGNQVQPGKYKIIVIWMNGTVESDIFTIIDVNEVSIINAYIIWVIVIGVLILILFFFIYVSKIK